MKKTTQSTRLLLALLFSLLLLAGCEKEPQGTGSGKFSVSKNRQVRFALGNLADDGCSFTDHQWDFGGVFCWGTGDDPANYSPYYQDHPTFHDWGDNIEGNWRTLSTDEWAYILEERPDANLKYALGTVNNIRGLILLPDKWKLPDGCNFIPETKKNSDNIYSHTQWGEMEANGAVLIPATMYDSRSDISWDNYWTSSPLNEYNACTLNIGEESFKAYYLGASLRGSKHPVRLVWDM